ncbi:MAG TPA: VWA domain-containing protein [Pirellulaceae bacterium]|nr:VWA domain-containing protein [Pirellulaceae bacterium]HMO92462.1 VWA domain-containing protein [Pirellulaceae bacterium]HMP67868.1 VWA domain-containing protein [Pirellulaceae bacterium]
MNRNRANKLGGILHTYQKFDPAKFPSPSAPPPDFVSPIFEQMMAFGRFRRLSEEELARAVRLDPSQFSQLGPSIEMIRAILLERRRRILETYETDSVKLLAHKAFHEPAAAIQPPHNRAKFYREAIIQEQLYDLEKLWYSVSDDASPFSRSLVILMEHLGNKYQIDELASKYEFTGPEPMTIELALQIKEELEKIDELLKQLDEAEQTAQIAVIDMESLEQFVNPSELAPLDEMKRLIENYVREQAERQGFEHDGKQFQLTPQALRMFQGKLLERIFDKLSDARTGRHQNAVIGDGAIELAATKPYEFGDSVSQMDIPQSMVNAMIRQGVGDSITLVPQDIEIHKTRNSPKCATVIIMDMSGSMRYDGQYIDAKRMALALDGLIRKEYPGDFLAFVEMYTFGKVVPPSEVIDLMPKPVTLFDPVVRLSVDMSRNEISEHMVHQHFTNMQHSLKLARQLLSTQNTLNRQIVLITDGLPTAHFDETVLHLMYPAHPETEAATMREVGLCVRENITINMFLVPSWSQSEEDIRFAYRLAESAKGRVFFTNGKDLDRFVVWDYLTRKREILG